MKKDRLLTENITPDKNNTGLQINEANDAFLALVNSQESASNKKTSSYKKDGEK